MDDRRNSNDMENSDDKPNPITWKAFSDCRTISLLPTRSSVEVKVFNSRLVYANENTKIFPNERTNSN